MKKILVIGLIFTVGAIAAMLAGNWYWHHKKIAFFERLNERKSFTFVDGKGKLFNTGDFPEHKNIIVIFTPDAIPVSAVKPFRFFLEQYQQKIGDKIGLVVITRVHEDIVKNFLSAARFHGRLLLDPAGAFGNFLGVWPNMQPVSHWTFVLTNRSLRVFWAVASKEIPTFKAFDQQLEKKTEDLKP